jgi:hypothetical protein
MAVAIAGTASVIEDSDDSVSQSVTVPGGTTLVVLCISGYLGSTNWLDPSDFSLGGTPFTNVVDTDSQTANGQVWIGYLVNPSTGSQTFSGSLSFPNEGMTYVLVYLSGVDTASPIRDSDIQTTSNVDISGLTTSSGDMMVGVAYSNSTSPTVTDGGQTQIRSATFNSAGIGVANLADASGFQYSNASFSTCAAVIVAVSSATPTLEQEGFRFRKDDGSESTATWEANQDTNITVAVSIRKRLRMLVNATGDAASKQFKLQYRKQGAASWRDIP